MAQDLSAAVSEVLLVEHAALGTYTPDAFTRRFNRSWRPRSRRYVLLAAYLPDARFCADGGGANGRLAHHRCGWHQRHRATATFVRPMFQGEARLPRCVRRARTAVRHDSDRRFPSRRREARRCRAGDTASVDIDAIRDSSEAEAPFKERNRRSTSARPSGSWRSVGESSRRRTSPLPSGWPKPCLPRSRRRGRSATTAGCPWIARSAAPVRPSRRSFTSPSASPAPSSTSSA